MRGLDLNCSVGQTVSSKLQVVLEDSLGSVAFRICLLAEDFQLTEESSLREMGSGGSGIWSGTVLAEISAVGSGGSQDKSKLDGFVCFYQ